MEEEPGEEGLNIFEHLTPDLFLEVNASPPTLGAAEDNVHSHNVLPAGLDKACDQLDNMTETDAAKEARLKAALAEARTLADAQDDNPKLIRDYMHAKDDLDAHRADTMQRQIQQLLLKSQDKQQFEQKKFTPTIPNLDKKLAKSASRSFRKKKPKPAPATAPAQPDNEQAEVREDRDTAGQEVDRRVTRASLSSLDGSDDLAHITDSEEEVEAVRGFDSGVRISTSIPMIKEGVTFKDYKELT